MHAVTLLGARQLRQDYARYSTQVEIRIVPPLCPLSQSAYDYSNGANLIAAARTCTRQWLDNDGLNQTEFPEPLAIHSHP
jgi:NTE family protein